MELTDLPELASHADAGTDVLAPRPPADRAQGTMAPPTFMESLGIQGPPSPDALDNARRGTWVMNDYLDGWTLMGANGRPVMRADGSKVAFWFRDIDRLAREWAPTDGSAPPTTKQRPGLAALDSGFDSDWDPSVGQSYRADVTKSARLLSYYFAQRTEPEEAVRRATAMVLDDPVMLKEGNIDAFVPKRHDLAAAKTIAHAMWFDLVGVEPAAEIEHVSKSESDEVADVYRAAGKRLRHGRSTGGGTSIFDLVVDIEKGAIAGLRDGVQEAIQLLAETGNAINQSVLDEWEIDLTIAPDFEWPVLPDAPAPQTAGGEVAKSVAQFLVGFVPALKSIKVASGGAALTKAGKFAQAEGAAAIASATVLDPLEERLSNTWQELDLPENVLTDYLAASPDDSEAEGRFKNAIESLVIGSGLAGGLALSARILRAARRAMTPRGVVAGGLAGTGLAAEGDSKTNPSLEGESFQNSESESLLDPYAGGAASAMAFAGSNQSVDAREVRRRWEEHHGKPWPVDDKGRRYDVHHDLALEDGGTNDLDNIIPMQHDEHMRHHKENGDFSRWAKARWARRKAAIAEAAANALEGAKAAAGLATKIVTGGKLKID